MFTGGDMVEWASQMKIKMLHSTPYYAQANGQGEVTNNAIKLIVQKMIEENPRQWHVLLSEAVWANRTRQKSATGTSPFRIVYGHDAMLPMELTVMSTRLLYQNKFSTDDDFNKMAIFPIDHKDRGFGKWSPNWEGPFIVTTKLVGGAYVLADMTGKSMTGRLTVSFQRNMFLVAGRT
ncbi:uncharacterized protein LOC126669180 [Mercurialis annua]|uniref:uncharacterized protein LOC126669180 n=1 Tax=Mercurialis annua TaxID=3986 RepID=UPI0021604B0E|nr:uncharacterized protein LOC126669180 [Mercurialis annua]